jgi:hypothetical protein
MSWKIAWVVSWVGTGTGTGSVSGSSEELGYARNKAGNLGKRSKALPRPLARSLSPTCYSHASRSALTSNDNESKVGPEPEPERLFVSWPPQAGEEGEKGRKASVGAANFGLEWRWSLWQQLREVHLSTCLWSCHLKSVWPSRARHFQMITTTVWRLGLSRSCKVANVACALPETLSHSHTHGPFDANDQTILPRFERRSPPCDWCVLCNKTAPKNWS